MDVCETFIAIILQKEDSTFPKYITNLSKAMNAEKWKLETPEEAEQRILRTTSPSVPMADMAPEGLAIEPLIEPKKVTQVDRKSREGSKNSMFRKEMLAFFGKSTLDEVQNTVFSLEIVDNGENPNTELMAPRSDSLTDGLKEESLSRDVRCQFCHQPIKSKVRVVSENNIALIGVDCAAKLRNFSITGEIKSVNLQESRRNFQKIIQTGIEGSGLASFEAKMTRTKPAVSMLTWCAVYIDRNPGKIPENIQKIFAEIKTLGCTLSSLDAQTLLDWYIKERTIVPKEVFTDREADLLITHPHERLIRKSVETPQTIIDARRAIEILHKYDGEIERSFLMLADLVKRGLLTQVDGLNNLHGYQAQIMSQKYQEFFGETDLPTKPIAIGLKKEKGHVVHTYIYNGKHNDQFLFDRKSIRLPYHKIPYDVLATRLDFVLHSCYTVVVESRGKILVMDGDTVISDDFENYLLERGKS